MDLFLTILASLSNLLLIVTIYFAVFHKFDDLPRHTPWWQALISVLFIVYLIIAIIGGWSVYFEGGAG